MRPMHTNRRHGGLGRGSGGCGGFTLIELLVVVSIISLLVSISLPTLSKAREQARGVVCQVMMREINTGLVSYATSNDGRSPPLVSTIASTGKTHCWADTLYGFQYGVPASPREDMPAYRNSSKGSYEGLFVCKSAQVDENTTGCYRVWQPGWHGKWGLQSKLRTPVIFDGVCDAWAYVEQNGVPAPVLDPSGTRSKPLPWQFRDADDPEIGVDERHLGGANFLFPDSSVQRKSALRERLAIDPELDGLDRNGEVIEEE